jgi:hypothetical protein
MKRSGGTRALLGLCATLVWLPAQGCGDSSAGPGDGDATTDDGRDAVCVPRTCEDLGAGCGEPPNGCGGTLDCGDPTGVYTLPADRATEWRPGVTYGGGGIPARPDVCATVSPSGGDDTAAIQAAIDGCPENQVVQLTAGDFVISGDGLALNRSNLTLRGAGPTETRLSKTDENGFPVILIGNRWSADKFLSATYPLAADGEKGSRTITLAAVPTPPLTPGEIVRVDQTTNPGLTVWSPDSPPGDPSRGWECRMDRPISQILEVASADGASVTFQTPLHIGFATAFGAELARYGEDWRGLDPVPATKWSGVEDLYVEGGTGGNIQLDVCAYCWVRRVESAHSIESSVGLVGCYRSEVRDSYIHTSDNPNPGGAGYLIDLSWGSSDNLVENNIVWFGNKLMVMRSAGGGNVIAYNYMEDSLIGYQYNWVESGLNAAHMTTTQHALFEGNQCFNFDGESTWGNAIYNTVLRNHLTSKRRDLAGVGLTDEGYPRAFSLAFGHWWYTALGNVLGAEGMDPSPLTAYEYEGFYPWDADPVGMWLLGVGYDWGEADPQVAETLIRHGNFDYVTNTQIWDPEISNHNLPASLYLTEKPAFFGSYAWPWVDPGGTVKVHTLPARARYDAGDPFAAPPP